MTLALPSPSQGKLKSVHSATNKVDNTLNSYSRLVFKKRIMSTFLGLMLLLLAATTYQPLSDSTDVPSTQSINHVSLATSKCVM